MSSKICTVCGKDKPFSAYSPSKRGLQPSCKQCRNYKAAAKTICVTAAEQRCRACQLIKQASQFNRSKHRKNGLQSECKQCTRDRKASVHYAVSVRSQVCCDCGVEKPASEFGIATKRVSGIRKECRDCTSIRNRSQLYSLSIEQVKALCSVGTCDICGASFATARDRNIDHCHATGAVRGTLCNLCNRMLGSARDRPDVLETAAEYLRATRQEMLCG